MNDLFAELGLRRVINGCGYVTALGASPVWDEVIAAVNGILPHNVEMTDLQRAACEAIAKASGAEAGCVTACAASGIAVSVAATMTGGDLSKIELLPDSVCAKNEVIIQRGHAIDYSGHVLQMIRITGAKAVEVGSTNGCGQYNISGAINERTACGLFVVSSQAPSGSFVDLSTFIGLCHARSVPVVVDAATDYDLRAFVELGADLVVQSGHKRLGGLTAGVIAGRLELVRAAYMQERGIGRAMKVGKEGVVGVIAALKRHGELDQAEAARRERARAQMAVERLAGIKGITAHLADDPTGKPLAKARFHVEAEKVGVNAVAIARRLAEGNPTIKIEDYDSASGYLAIEPTCLSDVDMETICARIAEIAAAGGGSEAKSAETFDDRRHRLLASWPQRIPGGPMA